MLDLALDGHFTETITSIQHATAIPSLVLLLVLPRGADGGLSLLVCLFTALFVDCGSLLDAGIVTLELHAGVEGEVENALHCLPAKPVSYAVVTTIKNA